MESCKLGKVSEIKYEIDPKKLKLSLLAHKYRHGKNTIRADIKQKLCNIRSKIAIKAYEKEVARTGIAQDGWGRDIDALSNRLI